jgi:hypothetical protein
MKLKKWLRKNKPNPLEHIDWTNVIVNCQAYIDKIAEDGGSDFTEDEKHYIFESAIEAVFGAGVWKNYVNLQN